MSMAEKKCLYLKFDLNQETERSYQLSVCARSWFRLEQNWLHLRLQREWAGQRGAGHRILERGGRSGQVRENICKNW